jgi:hypothetical protein
MTEFKSWRSYWEFEHVTKQRTRYVHDPEIEAFLQAVRQTGEKRAEIITAGRFLWRAQLGHDWEPSHQNEEFIGDVPSPYPPERMKPPAGRATEGRANPKGIPYLYLATDRDTALAEVRPWIGSSISIGQFKTLRELRIVYCATERKGFHIYLEDEPSPQAREEAVWADIDRAFATPVSPSDDVADYAPTQIIAELFKANGFDGVAYRSSLGGGHNIALFDLDTTELINCFLFQAKKITFEFEEAANPYFLRRHYDNKKSERA